MRLDVSQQMRMLQQMKLAPRMIQSMEILQLPIMALEERIRQEVEENAMLELGTSATDTATTDLEAQAGESAVRDDIAERPAVEGPSDQEFEAIEQLYQEWNEDFRPTHQNSRLAGIEQSEKKHDAMQNAAARPVSLEDDLLDQLALCEVDGPPLRFARFLIANLDDHGFLSAPLEQLRAIYAEPISPEDAQRGLEVLRQLEPTGVGAADLRECLLLQLEDPPPTVEHPEILRTIIANHLDDLEHNRLPAIERKTGFSLDRIAEAIEGLRYLHLNPAAQFTTTNTQYVVPDVTVELDSTGQYVVRMNNENTPRVKISPEYLKMLHEKRGDPKVLEYLKKKLTAAQWLLDAIKQRRGTLEKVTRAIIEHQREFLEKGPDWIEPLKMQQIADRVGVHVTTVSRAVDDKWVQTPRGIFPLKRFFGGGTVTANGEEVAYDTIKRKLMEVINAENKQEPLSDDELVERLSALGYPLARRTVTKYRKTMGIPSSRQRKQHVR